MRPATWATPWEAKVTAAAAVSRWPKYSWQMNSHGPKTKALAAITNPNSTMFGGRAWPSRGGSVTPGDAAAEEFRPSYFRQARGEIVHQWSGKQTAMLMAA